MELLQREQFESKALNTFESSPANERAGKETADGSILNLYTRKYITLKMLRNKTSTHLEYIVRMQTGCPPE